MNIKTKNFIEKSINVHGERYDYSNTLYVKSNEKLIITCRVHGEFKQTPNQHLSKKNGCPECSGNKPLTTESFIEKAKIIHGSKYDYSKSVYITSYKKISIICKSHGMFTQTPNHHLSGAGCNSCYLETPRMTTEEFILKANIIHDKKYSYEKSQYKSSRNKIIIICPKHGEFKQTPNSHLSGRGCPDCAVNGYKTYIPGYFYIFEILNDDKIISYKFGITNNLYNRRYYHEYHSKYKFNLVYNEYFEDGKKPLIIENIVKQKLNCSYLSKNNYNVGYTETVSPNDFRKIIDIIKKGA